jgi:signal peptidase I
MSEKHEATAPGFIDTWMAATFSPGQFFSRPARKRSSLGPVVFAMIIGAGAGFGGVVVRGMLDQSPPLENIGRLVIAPPAAALWAAVSVFILAAITHFWLIVAGVKPRSFRDTLECVGYSSAPAIFNVVPLVGPLVGGVWQLVVLGVGLKNAQRTTAARAAFATAAGPLGLIALAIFVRVGAMEAFKIPAGSMMPTLMIGDHIFINKLAYGPLIPGTDARLFSRSLPKRSDVMVFKFPENKDQDFIKRAIAMPGDTLEVINGRPILNGWLVPHCHVGPFSNEGRVMELYVEFLEDRSYLTLFDSNPDKQTCKDPDGCGPGSTCRAGICGVPQGPFKVAPGETWVIGDNRNNSHDSRSWRGGLGAGVPFENIKGRAMFVWMSFKLGGEVAQDRLFADILGEPVIPGPPDAALGAALEKCLRERPPAPQTTPPAPGASRL